MTGKGRCGTKKRAWKSGQWGQLNKGYSLWKCNGGHSLFLRFPAKPQRPCDMST